jgi:hypothetical protein
LDVGEKQIRVVGEVVPVEVVQPKSVKGDHVVSECPEEYPSSWKLNGIRCELIVYQGI